MRKANTIIEDNISMTLESIAKFNNYKMRKANTLFLEDNISVTLTEASPHCAFWFGQFSLNMTTVKA